MLSRTLFCALLSLLALGTAKSADPPPVATGLAATIADSGSGGGPGGGTFFVLSEVDGTSVPNAIDASQRASRGSGAYLRVVGASREIAAGRVKLKLVARIAHAAPIGEIFGALRNDPVSGVIEVELQPGGRYRVTGNLDPFRREVWLEDEVTRQMLGEKIVQPPSTQAQAQMAGATTFACCNLYYDDDWIGDGPYTTLPFVPAGARIRFIDWGRNRANVLIEGRKMSIGVDFARKQTTREEFAKKMIVDENPDVRIAGWSADVQAAVRTGKVMQGMTREQVIVSLGYPRLDLVPGLEAPQWTYFADEEAPYTLVWGNDGKLKSIDAPERIRRLVTATP